MNKQQLEIKWTKQDEFINNVVVFVFSFQLCLMFLLGTIGNVFKYSIHDAEHTWYFGDVPALWWDFVIIPIRFLLLCSLLIPQSLKITGDVGKYLLSKFIEQDLEIYDSKNDSPAIVQNSAICDDLGVISHIFSDKTGTITRNTMVFKKFCVNGTILNADSVFSDDSVIEFFRCIALCNSLVETISEGKPMFRSSSPDEEALVSGANPFHVSLIRRTPLYIEIKVGEVIETFEILKMIDFTSERKRMTIFLKGRDDEVIIYSKGADDVILSSLDTSQMEQAGYAKRCLKEFGSEGLRTLCMATKRITLKEYALWLDEYDTANREILNRSLSLSKAHRLIEESGFQLLGASGIEDLLQDDVHQTISSLRDAGIVIWMLTGDKLETAIQIGHSCCLIPSSEYTTVITLKGDTDEQIYQMMKLSLVEREFCLVVEGSILSFVLKHEKLFTTLASKAISVIGCRMSPMQKGKIVDVMKNAGKRCLAIGDGGNDVPMIRKAHIGVGVRGKEGLAAQRASDFAISSFNYLQRLLLVHGRNSHIRMAYISQYTVYKSYIVAFSQLIFSLLSGFGGSPVLTSFSLMIYNTFLTAMLPLCWLYNKDIRDEGLVKVPDLYRDNQYYMTIKTFVWCLSLGIYQAIVVSSLTYGIFSGDYLNLTGYPMDYWKMGLVVLTCLFSIQIIMVCILIDSINVMNLFYIVTSVILFVLLNLYGIIPLFKTDTLFYGIVHLLVDPIFYILVFVVVIVAIAPVILFKAYVHLNSTSYLANFVRENERRNETVNYGSIVDKIREKSVIFHSVQINDSSEDNEETTLLNSKMKKK